MMKSSAAQRTLRSLAWLFVSCTVIITVWEIASRMMSASIILPSPLQTLSAMGELVGKKDFTSQVGATILRGIAGFLVSFVSGAVAGLLLGLNHSFRRLFFPVLNLLRATPVLSIILLSLIWFHTDTVPVFVTFLSVFPIVSVSIMDGLAHRDTSLGEMAEGYGVPPFRRLVFVVLPSLLPSFIGAASAGIGLTWKVVIAAEVLSRPVLGVGSQMQDAKIYLDTPQVFAWTFVAIALTSVSEGLFRLLSKRLSSWNTAGEDYA